MINREFIKKILIKLRLFSYIKRLIEIRHLMLEKKRNILLKKNGIYTLEKIKDVLGDRNIPFWLEFGTLLGAVRDKDFISHDTDIDLGIMYKDRPDDFQKLLEKSGFRKKYSFYCNQVLIEERYEFNGNGIDFSYFFDEGNYMYTYVFLKLSEESKMMKEGFDTIKYKFTKFDRLLEFEFKGLSITIPDNFEQSIIEKYGKNWKVPDKNWNFLKSPNIEILKEKSNIKYEN